MRIRSCLHFAAVALALLAPHLAGALPGVARAQEEAPALPASFAESGATFDGNIEIVDQSVKVNSRSATLTVPAVDLADSEIRFRVNFGENAGGLMRVFVAPDDADQPVRHPAGAYFSIRRQTGKEGGLSFLLTPTEFDTERNRWAGIRSERKGLTLWPRRERDQVALTEAGFEEPDWSAHWFNFRLVLRDGAVRLWIDGDPALTVPVAAQGEAPVLIEFFRDDTVRDLKVGPAPAASRFVTAPLDAVAHADSDAALDERIEVGGVPFELVDEGRRHVDLREAEWPQWESDPSSYYEAYDNAPAFRGDPRRPVVSAPRADYVAAHVLAVAVDDENTWPGLTLRAGRLDQRGQVQERFFSGNVPRRGASAELPGIDTSAGRLFSVRIPMPRAFAQDIRDERIDVELTKQVRLARRRPDPARFRYRPLGLPSGAQVWAVTFEKSPLQMNVTSDAAGHAFEQPEKPTFSVELTNITDQAQPYTLRAEAKHLHGDTFQQEASGTVAPSDSATVELTMPYDQLGYHSLSVKLLQDDDELLLDRRTSFAMLPRDEREHFDEAPWGVWDFSGGHYTGRDPELLGPLYRKLGMRYGMFKPYEARKKWNVRQGREPRVLGEDGAESYRKFRENNPDFSGAGLLMHENSVSGPHVMRAPTMFTDRPPYEFSESEQERFDNLWEQVKQGAESVRSEFPDAHLRLGNGPLPTKEAFLRHEFPAELFDSIGNESGVFGRPPEAQPPDYVTMNAGIWMDNQLVEHYGYDKPVTQCFETCYPSTNPGNLSLRTQADYYVRHAIHGLAWDIPLIRLGLIMDVGNSYYYSNWGSSGFCFKMPEASVKPSFVSWATMTRVLDGATYEDALDFGTYSLYATRLSRADEKTVYVLWTPRGQRTVRFGVEADIEGWVLVDSQGNPSMPETEDGELAVTFEATPKYLVGEGKLSVASIGAPDHSDGDPAEDAQQVASLDSLDDWRVQEGRDTELETHNFLAPRRKGDFAFEAVDAFEGRENVIRVTPRPVDYGKATMPMYGSIEHEQGVELPGEPTEIGVWVNGNSSWGRVIFELTDAEGERWISIGANYPGGASPWMQDWMPEEMIDSAEGESDLTMNDWNTNDVFGYSRFDFDGWRYVSMPLPGNYPGEQFHWPANSQWKSTDDAVVQYPLTLKRIVVELPEKTLYLTEYEPAVRPEVYLDTVHVSTGEKEWLAPVEESHERSAHPAR
ncbi:MAG: hypothetical protein ACODAQ_01305 [Phycisphaeraceae bacterium]